ncbi:MAG: Flagellar assembly protein FliH/Type secretion system HrpE [Candidatus Eremiobacteraeota bacterium]|nr:Flagellar assembly protein FliH/Type secretion system HrpE [Candidatus Eremiobacteraeota bacterium]
MGRVVKGARFREERYALEVPEIAAPAVETTFSGDFASPELNGFGELDDALLFDAPLGGAPAVPAVDVEAIRAQADALLHDAARNAETLIEDAHNRARALIEDAAARADGIAQTARKRGHEEGFQTGRDAADREMNDMLVTMRGLLEMARAERHKLMEEAEPELVRLALGIAERVLHQQVALDRGVVVEMAKTAISRLIERDSVTVRVNPADLERMREHRDELIAIGDVKNLRVVEDKRVDRGGVIVDTDAGTIDARIGTQLEEARKILHIEDDVVIEPAADVLVRNSVPTSRAS